MDRFQKLNKFFKSLPNILSKRTRISAVHDDDLSGFLNSLGLEDEINEGKHFCMNCKKSISMDNLWGILNKDGSIKFICSDTSCIADIN